MFMIMEDNKVNSSSAAPKDQASRISPFLSKCARVENPVAIEQMVEKYYGFVKHCTDSIFLVNAVNHNILYANSPAQSLFNMTLEQLQGQKLEIEFKINNTIETNIMTESQQRRIVEIWSAYLNDEENKIVVRIRDISYQKLTLLERSSSNDMLNQLVDGINEVFWLSSKDFSQVYYVSPAYETIWGRSRASLYDNPSSWCHDIHPDDRDAVFKNIEQLVKNGENLNCEYRIHTSCGEMRWIRDRSFPIFDANGQIHRIAGIAEDITTHRLNEVKIKDYQKQLAHYSRLNTASEMVASIAHELNQPLAAINNYLNGFMVIFKKHQNIDAKMLDILEKAMAQSIRAGNIVHELKDFISQGSQDRVLIHNPSELIDNMLRFINLQVLDAKVNIEKELDYQCCSIKANKIQIEQVLVNIIQNAIESFSDTPVMGLKPKIKIKTICDNHNFVVEIIDNGPGIKTEIQDKIFNSFFSTKHLNHRNGMGMGLCISKTIIEAHGGKIEFSSRMAVGTNFTLKIPCNNT